MGYPYKYKTYCSECGNVADADIDPVRSDDGELMCSRECKRTRDVVLALGWTSKMEQPETESQVESVMFVRRDWVDGPIGAKPQAVLSYDTDKDSRALTIAQRCDQRDRDMQHSFLLGGACGALIVAAVLPVALYLVGAFK